MDLVTGNARVVAGRQAGYPLGKHVAVVRDELPAAAATMPAGPAGE
jgi:hypothetical protein